MNCIPETCIKIFEDQQIECTAKECYLGCRTNLSTEEFITIIALGLLAITQFVSITAAISKKISQRYCQRPETNAIERTSFNTHFAYVGVSLLGVTFVITCVFLGTVLTKIWERSICCNDFCNSRP